VFNAVAVDGGAVYVAGYQYGGGTFYYGGHNAGGGFSTGTNVVLVKYNAATGDAEWARTVTTGPNASEFNAVAVDGGTVYAAGYQGAGSFTYGPLVDPFGSSSQNVVLVKYNTSGDAQWARTLTGGTGNSRFYAAALGGPAVYASGFQGGTGLYDYGDGKTAAATGGYSGNNVALVKYPKD
jgi:hypothetical protein